MDRSAAGDRRATDAQPRVRRRWGASLRAALYRPLAQDDDRAAYWVSHIRIGILLSETGAVAALGYLLLTDTPGHSSRLLFGLVALVVVGTPLVFLLPLAEMMRDSRGP